MPRPSHWLLAVFSCAAGAGLTLVSGPARAAGGVAGSPSPAIVEARVAVASVADGVGGRRTTQWAALRVTGAGGGFVWLLPVKPGSAVDVASDAFFDALDDATAPRIVPVGAPAACDLDYYAYERIGSKERRARRPLDTEIVATRSALDASLRSWGFDLEVELGARVDEVFARGDALVAMTFAGPTGEEVTPTLRVVGAGAPVLPLVLTRARSRDVRVSAFGVATGRVRFGDLAPVSLGRGLTWGRDGVSSYTRERDVALAGAAGKRFFLEAAGGALFFGAEPRRPPDFPVVYTTPLVAAYAARARTYGDSSGNDACVDAAHRAARDRVVGRPCARGDVTLGAAASEPCAPRVEPGETAPATFACGGIADDLAFALAGMAPGDVWLTRAAGIVPANSVGEDVIVDADPGAARSPIFTADASGLVCGRPPGPVPVPFPETAPSPSRPAPPTTSTPQADPSYSSHESGGCSGGPTTSGQGSGGSTSSTEGEPSAHDDASSSSACSGDTSTSSEGDDDDDTSDGCATDGTSDGDDDGSDDACSTDGAGDDDGSDDACSTDGTSDDGDDDCSNEARPRARGTTATAALSTAPTSLNECRLDRPKPRPRSPVSRAVLGLAALLIPLRRMTRKL